MTINETRPTGGSGADKNVLGWNENDSTTKKLPNHSATDQRQRVLRHLKQNHSATTIDFRTEIDVLHPAARIMELRRRGHNIVLSWDYAENPGGTTHRIGRYTLLPGKYREVT